MKGLKLYTKTKNYVTIKGLSVIYCHIPSEWWIFIFQLFKQEDGGTCLYKGEKTNVIILTLCCGDFDIFRLVWVC